MKIIDLYTEGKTPREHKSMLRLEALIRALGERELEESLVSSLNETIAATNEELKQGEVKARVLNKRIASIIGEVEKKAKLVPKNHYQTQWMPLGMALFGVPMGVVFGLTSENMAFLGIGLPIGMGIGIALGRAMDMKAAKDGRQLSV